MGLKICQQILHNVKQTKKEKQKQKIQVPWDNFKRCNVQVMRTQEEERAEERNS